MEDPGGLFRSRGCRFFLMCHTDRGRDLNHALVQITFTKGRTTEDNGGIDWGHMGCKGAAALLGHIQGNL